jgi:hypothetical protein
MFMRHTSLLAALAATVLALAALSSSAPAAPIRECGNYGDHYWGWGWGYSRISGAGIYNLTTRRVRCHDARWFALHYRGTDWRWPKWRCREHNAYEFSDVRCVASRGRVIHWQSGS